MLFIHIWSAAHGIPDSYQSAAQINSQLASRREAVPLESVSEIIQRLKSRYPSVSIAPAFAIEADQNEDHDQRLPQAPTASPPSDELQLWSSAPAQAYSKFAPISLRIGLPGNAVERSPCAYELLQWCKSHQLIACTGEDWPDYWLPDGGGSNTGKAEWQILSEVLRPLGRSSAPTRGIWRSVVEPISAMLLANGFQFESNTTIFYGRLAAFFSRDVVGGHQRIRLTIGQGSSSPEWPSAPPPLNLRMHFRMSMDVMDDANEELNIRHIGNTQYIFDYMLNAMSEEQFPKGIAEIEKSDVLQEVNELLRAKLLPLMNQCSTPAGAMSVLREPGQIGREPEMEWILPRLALAWHVGDTQHYAKLKDFFLSYFKTFYSSEEDEGEWLHLVNGVKRLEKMPPKYVS